MKYRVTARFGEYEFSAECQGVTVAFHHLETLILSPLFCGGRGERRIACEHAIMELAAMERGEKAGFSGPCYRVTAE